MPSAFFSNTHNTTKKHRFRPQVNVPQVLASEMVVFISKYTEKIQEIQKKTWKEETEVGWDTLDLYIDGGRTM